MNTASSLLTRNPQIHPQFRSKPVCLIHCSDCHSTLCNRGMRAILLGNTNIELYSTDKQPCGVSLIDQDYVTKNCQCRIRDAACLGCGNVVGYHVTAPCIQCLESCNNGHFWMFTSQGVSAMERIENGKVLRWSALGHSHSLHSSIVLDTAPSR